MNNDEARRAGIIAEIVGERQRQIEEENYSVVLDDAYIHGEIALAAAAYALTSATRHNWKEATLCALGGPAPHFNYFPGRRIGDLAQRCWPWGWEKFETKEPRRDLVRAAALIVAEIERLDRMSAQSPSAAD